MRDNQPLRLRERKALVFVTGGLCVGAFLAASLWGATARRTPLLEIEDTSGQWVNIGPAPAMSTGAVPFAGRIASIAVDPASPSHWLVGVGNGGVWETRDTGQTWTAAVDDAPTLATGSVAFAPSDPSVVYVGTGESTDAVFGHSGVGILKSTDGLRTWTLLGASAFSRVGVKR